MCPLRGQTVYNLLLCQMRQVRYDAIRIRFGCRSSNEMNNNWYKYKNIIIYKEDNVLGRCVFRDIF